MAILNIFHTQATVNNYRWSCANQSLENFLNSFRDPLGPSPSDPNPDLTLAREMAQRFNGRVIRYAASRIPDGSIA